MLSYAYFRLPGWRNGRRRGLKPPGLERVVRVRVPPRVPSSTIGIYILLWSEILGFAKFILRSWFFKLSYDGSGLRLFEILNAELASWPVANWSLCVVDYSDPGDPRVQMLGQTDLDFALASVSKAVVALGVLVAIEEGLGELDGVIDPLGVTWRDLLAHCSGIAYDNGGSITSSDIETLFGTDALKRDDFFVRPRRERRIYSNFGFEALGFVLQRESEIKFAGYIDEAIFLPLEMKNSYISSRIMPQAGPTGASAGIVSNAKDMEKFLLELITPHLISTQTYRDATRSQYGPLPGVLPGFGFRLDNAWGLGIEIRADKTPHWTGSLNSIETFGHFGRSGTFFWIDPAWRIAMCFLGDRPFDDFAKSAWPKLADLAIATLNS